MYSCVNIRVVVVVIVRSGLTTVSGCGRSSMLTFIALPH